MTGVGATQAEGRKGVTSVSAALAQRAVDLRIPLEVLFELTYACNLRCCHCYLVEHRSPEQLSTLEVLRVLDELAAEGCLYLTLSGGEPLRRPDFWTIASGVRQGGFAWRLFTNGTLIGPREADRIAKLLPLSVEISIYGALPATHDSVTGEPGSLQKSLQAAAWLCERSVAIALKMPLMRDNFGEYAAVLRLASELGCAARFDPVITAKDDGSLDPLDLRVGAPQLVRLVEDERLFPPVDPGDVPGPGCGAGVSACSITPTGTVRPCVQMPLDCGSLREQTLHEIWTQSPVLAHLRGLRDEDFAACQGCTLAGYCSRCSGLALLEDGDLLGPSSAACRIAAAQAGLAHVTGYLGGVEE